MDIYLPQQVVGAPVIVMVHGADLNGNGGEDGDLLMLDVTFKPCRLATRLELVSGLVVHSFSRGLFGR